jgi:hypothetical protein
MLFLPSHIVVYLQATEQYTEQQLAKMNLYPHRLQDHQ